MQVRLALPKGRLLPATNAWLGQCGVDLTGYDENSRSYRPYARSLPNLLIKVFNEKDIPIQVAIGNYDLGICGREWVEELLAKYPTSAVVKVHDLGYGRKHLCVASSDSGTIASLDDLKSMDYPLRLATEFPHLAESFAMNLRIRRFRIFPVWGKAEAYPPENADLALFADGSGSSINHRLRPLAEVLSSSAWLIAHRPAWEAKDLSVLLDRFRDALPAPCADASDGESSDVPMITRRGPVAEPADSGVWIALPDGHQQDPTVELLRNAGIQVDMDSGDPVRPRLGLPEVRAKMIRPQDMPIQVANGNFDLAVTGEDWLYDHLCVFPSSPVRKILSLGFGKVRIVAVVSKSLPYQTPQDLRSPLRKRNHPVLRIASEYVNIADKYARDNHLSPYRLIPTWGASEAFLPEDADLLVENSQTGRTLAQHGLRIVDVLFESSACLIGPLQPGVNEVKHQKISDIVAMLSKAIPAE